MIGILRIELPDDFKKGECEKCPINSAREEPLSCFHYLSTCPLEIQNTCKTCKNIATALCNNCSVGKFDYYEQAEYSIELRKDNTQ